ncbi:BtrH N-terminal domain-containing protein [Clostridium sp. 'deep sea']|uniref:BtrH N-terminal domain-containing protein n=1 Tax=Clostridium sp. 'deep sea' TaxID=2779445 RepID=UPI0018966AFA|nr:BtrH N-terminal domain-containing protein [Clostridium sp. 'deep sea']QOR35003.1 BtrH N-terminal domain-containing protein [Clostridium sp. 'deep sea']
MKKIVDNFKTLGGKHCVTTALKQIFDYYNCFISEEMLFGLGCGLDFVYLNLASFPMISGRNKPFVFEKMLADNLNIKIKCKSSTSNANAVKKTKQIINNNKPVIIYVDMAYLKYLNLNKESHFGGHAVVLFGYDDEKQHYYISDRDNSNFAIRTPKQPIKSDFHLVSYNELAKARNSKYRPFPANNKYLDIDLTDFKGVTEQSVVTSITLTCNKMLKAPAKLLGINGINKFSKEVLTWNKFKIEKLKLAGINNYFQISADGGTGGGMFREMFADFLVESAALLNSTVIQNLGYSYKQEAKKWNIISELMWQLYQTANKNILKEISNISQKISVTELSLLTQLQYEINNIRRNGTEAHSLQ